MSMRPATSSRVAAAGAGGAEGCRPVDSPPRVGEARRAARRHSRSCRLPLAHSSTWTRSSAATMLYRGRAAEGSGGTTPPRRRSGRGAASVALVARAASWSHRLRCHCAKRDCASADMGGWNGPWRVATTAVLSPAPLFAGSPVKSYQEARQVLDAGIQAMGGLEALREIKDVSREGGGTGYAQGQGLKPDGPLSRARPRSRAFQDFAGNSNAAWYGDERRGHATRARRERSPPTRASRTTWSRKVDDAHGAGRAQRLAQQHAPRSGRAAAARRTSARRRCGASARRRSTGGTTA